MNQPTTSGHLNQNNLNKPLLPRISRRFILSAALPMAMLALTPRQLRAQETVVNGAALFLQFSRDITGHPELDATTAASYYAAMSKTNQALPEQVTKLSGLSAYSPADLLAEADKAGLKATALAIVAAWYTGSISNDTNAPTFAYLDALMYAPTRDGLSPPTYCHGKPAWWVEAPPSLGIQGPIGRMGSMGSMPKPTSAPAQGNP